MEKTVYITKYALTRGIIKAEAKIQSFNYLTKEEQRAYINGYYNSLVISTDAFFSFDEAKKKAEQMKLKKIASLKKQIQKLEKLSFVEAKNIPL